MIVVQMVLVVKYEGEAADALHCEKAGEAIGESAASLVVEGTELEAVL